MSRKYPNTSKPAYQWSELDYTAFLYEYWFQAALHNQRNPIVHAAIIRRIKQLAAKGLVLSI